VLRCRVAFNVIRDVLEYLLKECCAGVINIQSDGT